VPVLGELSAALDSGRAFFAAFNRGLDALDEAGIHLHKLRARPRARDLVARLRYVE
jgi:hypothetical protein